MSVGVNRWTTTSACLAWLLCACGGQERDAAAAPSEPAAPAQPAAPAPAAPSAPAAAAQGVNPCANPAPVTLELEAGVVMTTPWGLDITYAIEEDEKRGPSYVFLMRSGSRRWEARRNDENWTAKLTWRGICWRGGERPERRASKLQIQMAPVCKDGQLVEMGGCGSALGPE
jgi:hypothetical protein